MHHHRHPTTPDHRASGHTAREQTAREHTELVALPLCEPALGDLLRRAASRENAAWDDLVNRFDRLVFRAGLRIGLSRSDAADVAQQTWLRLLEHVDQIREPERLAAWLVATARREGLRVATDAKRYLLFADPTAEHGVERLSAAADVYVVDGEYTPEVEQALSRLPVRYQRLLRLLMSDERPSYTEISARLNLPIGSIGPMRMRALQMLRRTPEFSRLRRRQPATTSKTSSGKAA